MFGTRNTVNSGDLYVGQISHNVVSNKIVLVEAGVIVLWAVLVTLLAIHFRSQHFNEQQVNEHFHLVNSSAGH